MHTFEIISGSKDVILHVFIEDTRRDDGGGLTGLVYNSAGLSAYAINPGDIAASALALVDAAIGTHTDGGFKEVDSANMPGWYELHIPDALVANEFKQCSIVLKGAANMAVTNILVNEGANDRRFFCRFIPTRHARSSLLES